MALSTNLDTYRDCRDVFDRALDAPRGIKVTLDSAAQAQRLRMRLNQCRVLLRKDSWAIYAPDSPAYGKSAYDILIARIPRDDLCSVVIEPGSAYFDRLQIEEL